MNQILLAYLDFIVIFSVMGVFYTDFYRAMPQWLLKGMMIFMAAAGIHLSLFVEELLR